MRRLNQFIAPLVVFFLLATALPLSARTRKGEKYRTQARAEESKGNFDKALGFAEQAIAEDATDPAYMLELRRLKFQSANFHTKAGQKLRSQGNLPEALSEFQKAYGIDPASDIAGQEVQRTRQMMERNKNADSGQPQAGLASATGIKDEDKALTPAELSKKRSLDRAEAMLPVPELKPLNQDPINLKMSNKPRLLFETLGKLAGINVLFDPEYESQQQIRTQNIDLLNTNLDQALDQLGMVTKSYWKPMSANTIFVTVDNPQKRREYEENVVRIFYLSNVTTPQEIQEMQTVLRTVVDVSKVFPYTSQNALIVRAEADKMALVEKIIADLDKARAEVIVDVLVLEANSTYIRNLAAQFAPGGISTTASFLPRSSISSTSNSSTPATGSTAATTSTTTNIPLSNLGKISTSDYSISGLPGALLKAVLNDSGTRVLQSPQLRAADNFKATLKIGDKIPTATGSFQPGIGSVGTSALVNTQFTFIDVGVNIEMTPKVHDNGEVSLHLDIDVSQVKDRIDLGGISQPEIGQRKSTQDIRVRDGEISVIGGLMQQQDSKSLSGIPFLSKIPVLGRFFSTENVERDRTELLITLVPHIVRGPDVTESNLKTVASGNSTTFKVGYAARKIAEKPKDAAPAAGAPPATAPIAIPAPAALPPATAPVLPAGPARLSFAPSNVDATLASGVTVTIYAENVTDLASIRARLQYDPKILAVTNIQPGDLPQKNGSQLQPVKNILNDTGTADFSVTRSPQDGGVSGSGGVFTILFQAIGRGNSQVTISNVAMQSAAKQPIATNTPPPLIVNVK